MTSVKTDRFLLGPAAADRLADRPVHGLRPVATEAGGALAFIVLDDFDRSLARSDRLLLELPGSVQLLDDTGRAVPQAGSARGKPASGLPDGPVRSALADLPPLRHLLPLGEGLCRRQTLSFVDDEGKTRCRAHLLRLDPQGGEGVVIVSLEGLRGYRKAFETVRRAISEDDGGAAIAAGDGVPVGALADRLFPGLPAYSARPDVRLAAGEPARDAATALIAAQFPVLRANEAGIIADLDTEFLHDYRVALRRIRSVLSLFKGVYDPDLTAALKARFRALMEPTGALRDLDVFLLDRDRTRAMLPDSLQSGLETKFALLARDRRSAQGRLSRHLRSRTYLDEIAALEALFADPAALAPGPDADRPARDFASALILKRYRRMCGIAAQIGPDSPDEAVHGLRIEGKKLRYLMEFFAPLFPARPFRALLRPLKALQDRLGLVNDCAVQQASLQRLLRRPGRKPGPAELDLAQSVGALTAMLHHRQAEARAGTSESLAAFTGPRMRRGFRDLFSAGGDGA